MQKNNKDHLFELSVVRGGKYSNLLIPRPEYEDLVTFSENKTEPVYNWFYYKEGFSRDLVWNLLNELKIPKGALVLDPFCGTGTTLLAAKQKGYNSAGFDILPLGVFVANTKLQEDYNVELLQEKMRELSLHKFGSTTLKWADPGFIDLKKAFSRYARNDILFFKEKIIQVEDEKTRNFLMLGLLSIVSEASNTKKDGGVIKIVQKRHLAPVRFLLRNRLKRMFKDVKKMQPTGMNAEARLGDARDIQLEPESVDVCITSPPYLNFVDYTKIYGLELSLLLNRREEMQQLRGDSLRSHVGAQMKKGATMKSEKLKETMEKLRESSLINERFPTLLEGYFEDMYMNMESVYKVLKDGGVAAYNVGNTCLPDLTVDVDLIFAELGEQIGFKAKQVLVAKARWCDVAGIRKERPVRESIVILEK
jgi:DNA modification methylase